MAGEAKRFCNAPSCPQLISGAAHYCERHTKQRGRKYFSTIFDKFGKARKVADPFYSTPEWLAKKNAKRRANPICELCKQNLTKEVHHIKPKKEFPHLALNWDNLMSLCRRCHWKETQKEIAKRKEQRSNKAMWFPKVKGQRFHSPVTVVYHPPFLDPVHYYTSEDILHERESLVVDLLRIRKAVMSPGSISSVSGKTPDYVGHIRSTAIKQLLEGPISSHVYITASRMPPDTRREYAEAGARIVVLNMSKEAYLAATSSLGFTTEEREQVDHWYESYKRISADELTDIPSKYIHLRNEYGDEITI